MKGPAYRDRDGLVRRAAQAIDDRAVVHVIIQSESIERFGKLGCGTSYTTLAGLDHAGHLHVQTTHRMPTCVACIARQFR